MKNKLRPYFSFTKKERNGIGLLVILCVTLIFLPHVFPKKELQLADQTLTTGLQLLLEAQKNHSGKPELISPEKPVELFPFNPNTLDVAGWMRLGLEEKLAHRIIHYRNKGGRFYKAADVRKIWGLEPEKATQLIPFVQLPDAETKQPIAKPAIAVIDINTAGLEEWKALPGIGETIAGRIIKYRNQSLGFARLEELSNVFGLTDSTFFLIKPYLRLNEGTITKLLLNRASAYQLMQKAGLPDGLAREIVKRRQDEGNFSNWSVLEALPGMNKIFLNALQKAFQLE